MSSATSEAPFGNMTELCSMKAARDMCIRVLSEEHPDIRTVNFAPGMVETDMMGVVRQSWTFDRMTDWALVTPNHSVNKLVTLMKENKFVSASHVDVSEV